MPYHKNNPEITKKPAKANKKSNLVLAMLYKYLLSRWAAVRHGKISLQLLSQTWLE
jgi:hypothetical protein